ncbi:MAG: protein kinase [Sandaracinaceae bacterium]|nr:protein kinase [Sandaracinaceae bacterium]
MAETARDGSPTPERELAETVGTPPASAGTTGRAASGPARALFEMSPTMVSVRPPARERSTDLEAGTLLDESYRVISVLGRGGMGTVYLVEHTKLGRRFAAKVLADHLAADAVLVARLHAEARVASRLRHENIVDVTHLGQTSAGAIFIVMELLEGRDLRALLDSDSQGRGLPFPLVRSLAEDIFAALVAAHAQGVVHRDLKPENVFLSETDRGTRAKIVDFGIAKSGGEQDLGLTQTGQVIGTPLYMSPEQARDTSSVDARSDQYSLGIVLYEMLTGRLPFEAKNAYELVVMHATELPRPLRLLREDVPASVEQVVLRCLAKAADARFADMSALRDAWRDAWGAEPTSPSMRAHSTSGDHASRAESSRPAPDSASRPSLAAAKATHERWMAAAAVIVVAVLGAGIVAVLSSGRPGDTGASTVAAPPDAHVETDAAVALPDVLELPRAMEPPPSVRTVHTRPEGATLETPDGTTCTTPCDVTLPRSGSLEITLSLRGFRTVERALGLDDPDELTVTLPAQRSAGHAPELAPR